MAGESTNEKDKKMANNTLCVVSQSGESLTFYGIPTGTQIGRVTNLLPEPHELCYDDRSNLLYITHAYAHGWYGEHGDDGTKVSVFDCKQRQVIDTIDISPYGGPHGIALHKASNVLYVSVESGLEGAGGVIGIDLESHEIIKAIGSGHKTHWFVMTPDARKAYTCNKEAGYISVLDLVHERLVKKIDVPGGCEQPGISNDGKFAYFPAPLIGVGMWREGRPGDFSVQVVDTETDQVVESIPLEFGAVTIHVDAKDRLLVGQYRFDTSSAEGPPKSLPGRLTVLAPPSEDFRILATVETDLVPLTVLTTPDASKAFASNIFTGTVTVLDLEAMKVERILDVDVVPREDKKMHQGAHGLAVIA